MVNLHYGPVKILLFIFHDIFIHYGLYNTTTFCENEWTNHMAICTDFHFDAKGDLRWGMENCFFMYHGKSFVPFCHFCFFICGLVLVKQ